MRKIQKVSSSMAALLALLAFTQVPFAASSYACEGGKCKECAHGKKSKNCKCKECEHKSGADSDSAPSKSEEHKAE